MVFSFLFVCKLQFHHCFSLVDDLPQSTHEAVPGETANVTNPAPPSLQRQNGKTQEAKGGSISLKKTAVVVLEKLSACKIRAACRPQTDLDYSSEEDLRDCGFDTQWTPNGDCSDSSDSDWSRHNLPLKSNKKRKRHPKTGKFSKNKKAKASTPQAIADANVNAKISTTVPQRITKTSDTSKVTPSQINTSVAKEAATKQTKTMETLNAGKILQTTHFLIHRLHYFLELAGTPRYDTISLI